MTERGSEGPGHFEIKQHLISKDLTHEYKEKGPRKPTEATERGCSPHNGGRTEGHDTAPGTPKPPPRYRRASRSIFARWTGAYVSPT